MRKTILLLLTFALAATACAAPSERPGASFRNPAPTPDAAQSQSSADTLPPSPSPTPEPAEILESDAVKILGLYIDDAYRDQTSPDSVNRLVYLCYTVSALERRAVSLDSRSASVTISDKPDNKTRTGRSGSDTETIRYPSVRIPGACVWMPDFYYSDYLTDIQPGDVLPVAETFLVPADLLSGGKIIRFSKPGLPAFDSLRVSTDSITWCGNPEEVAQLADPEGYHAEIVRRSPADDETAERVRERINGRAWTVRAGGIYYRVAFAAPEHFAFFSGVSREELDVEEFNTDTLHQQENAGTYTVAQGYIICDFPADENDAREPLRIPYALENSGPDEKLSLNLYAAFDPDQI